MSTPEQSYKEYLQLFDRRYFEEGANGGYQLYHDYPCHWKTAQVVLDRKPTSALELGCAYGFVVKRLNDAGVPTTGIDVSEHCRHRRVTDPVVIADATTYDHPTLKVDLVYSVAFLELVPPDRVPSLCESMAKVARRGLHGISFAGDKWKRDKEWWVKQLPPDHEVLDKNEMEAPPFPIPPGDGSLKLNIGSFINMFHYGWMNMDIASVQDYAKQNGYAFYHYDVTQGLPYADGSVSLVYSAHTLEHFPYAAGAAFLKECYRVLKPGGVLRIGVPDAGMLLNRYDDRPEDLSDFDQINAGCERAKTPAWKLYEVLMGGGHQAIYDGMTLADFIKTAGFRVETSRFGRSVSPQMQKETFDVLPTETLYMEGVK